MPIIITGIPKDRKVIKRQIKRRDYYIRHKTKNKKS